MAKDVWRDLKVLHSQVCRTRAKLLSPRLGGEAEKAALRSSLPSAEPPELRVMVALRNRAPLCRRVVPWILLSAACCRPLGFLAEGVASGVVVPRDAELRGTVFACAAASSDATLVLSQASRGA